MNWASLALTLILAGCLVGCASNAQQPERITESDSPREPEQAVARRSKPVTDIPPRDVPGDEISGLPRYPNSVRVGYERGQRAGLETIRARYLTRDGLDAVRGFYRGVFRAKEWEVANVEFYEDEWTFLAIHGAREAEIELESREGDVTDVDIELSEPVPETQATKQRASQDNGGERPPKERAPSQPPRSAEQVPAEPAPQSASPTPAAPRSASPAPQSAPPAPQTASPAPQPPSPAPAPGYYGGDDDDGDDFDDEGGDD